MRVWLEEPKPKVRKSLLEFLGQPRTRGKTANEKRELLMTNQKRCSRISEYTDRFGAKALSEVAPDTVHGRLNRGFEELTNCALYARTSQRQFINRLSVNLPSQRYPPNFDFIVEIVVSRRTKFDVLIRTAIRSRKDLLHPFVKLLGERCQVLGVVEFRIC